MIEENIYVVSILDRTAYIPIVAGLTRIQAESLLEEWLQSHPDWNGDHILTIVKYRGGVR